MLYSGMTARAIPRRTPEWAMSHSFPCSGDANRGHPDGSRTRTRTRGAPSRQGSIRNPTCLRLRTRLRRRWASRCSRPAFARGVAAMPPSSSPLIARAGWTSTPSRPCRGPWATSSIVTIRYRGRTCSRWNRRANGGRCACRRMPVGFAASEWNWSCPTRAISGASAGPFSVRTTDTSRSGGTAPRCRMSSPCRRSRRHDWRSPL